MKSFCSTIFYTKVITEISRVTLGITFLFSGFVKSVDVYGTELKITEYLQAFTLDWFTELSILLSFVLVGFELLLGIWNLLGIYPKIISRLSLVTMSFMTLLTLYIAIFNPVEDCGCFGDAFTLSNWHTFYKNIVLLACAILLVNRYDLITPLFSEKTKVFAGVYCLLFTCGFLTYNYKYDPLFEFRPYQIGVDLKKINIPQDEPAKHEEISLIYEKKGVRKKFAPENSPWQDSTWIYIGTEINSSEEYRIHSARPDFSIYKPIFTTNDSTIESQIDITEKILSDTAYSFILLAQDMSTIDSEKHQKFAKITKYASEKGSAIYYLTSSPSKDIIKFQHTLPPNITLCTMDNKTLKTIVRTNSGLLAIHKGIIAAKWSTHSLPENEYQSIEELLSDSPPPANITYFLFSILILLFPLAIIKAIDHSLIK